MATTIAKFNTTTKMLMGAVDLDTSTLKLALVASTYTYSAAHTVWGDVSTNEIATGDGYTTGGNTLDNPTLTTVGSACVFDADDVSWASLTKTFRSGVVYAEGTFDSLVNPVLLYILFNNSGGGTNVTITGIDFFVIWNSSGILAI